MEITMYAQEIKRYQALNSLAEKGGIVIFGGKEDKSIPLCELRQAFTIESNLYNRSLNGLSVKDAISAYDDCVAPLCPETVMLHLGEADLDLCSEGKEEFEKQYRALLAHIRAQNKTCKLVIIAQRNYENAADIAEFNRTLRKIAEEEGCEFGDIAEKQQWKPLGMQDTMSFLYNTGFVRPLKCRRPIYDLIRILFCCEPCLEA